MKVPDIEFTNFIMSKFFNNKRDGVFIEAGANTGYEGSVCWELENTFGWSGVNIECNPHCFKELIKNRPRCLNIQAALSNKFEQCVFNFPTDGPRKLFAGQGSVIFNKTHWNGRPVDSCVVNTLTLEYILRKHSINNVDVLVLDVEGAEINALSGLTGSDVLPTVICVEDDKVDMRALDATLYELGYTKANKRYKNNGVYKYNG